jgi:hypothetical protein
MNRDTAIGPVATSLRVRAAALTSQKKSVGCSVMPAFFHDSFLGSVRLNLQQVAGCHPPRTSFSWVGVNLGGARS